MKISAIRHSAVVLGAGPGAFLDLPHWATVMSGLDEWPVKDCAPVDDARLLDLVHSTSGNQHVKELRTPPVFDNPEFSPRVPNYIFPTWFMVRIGKQEDEKIKSGSQEFERGRPLVPGTELVAFGPKSKRLAFSAVGWPGVEQKKYSRLIPMRFIRACKNGHCSDIPWEFLVHDRRECIGTSRLWVRQAAASGELSDLVVYCSTCSKSYSLSNIKDSQIDPKDERTWVLGKCDGAAPWLRDASGRPARLECKGEFGKAEPYRLLVRHATNAYFANTMSTVWLPPEATEIDEFVSEHWAQIQPFTSQEMLKGALHFAPWKMEFEHGGWSVEELWAAIQKKSQANGDKPQRSRDPYRPEIERMLRAKADIGSQARPDSDFHFRRLASVPGKGDALAGYLDSVSDVYLAHRVRVTVAQHGFTRLEPRVFPVSSEIDLDVRTAPLAHPEGGPKGRVEWLPAFANRGEGFLVVLDSDRVKAWRESTPVRDHAKAYLTRLDNVDKRIAGGGTEEQRVQRLASYMLLHSLSHALITAVSLDCGYSSASLAERIYNYLDAFAILIYTTSPDADGTLGGLVEAGRHIDWYLRDALRAAALCSSDPVCAASARQNGQRRIPPTQRIVNGAACHGCLMVSESSCERRNNDLLDRSFLVRTVEDEVSDAAFFTDVPE